MLEIKSDQDLAELIASPQTGLLYVYATWWPLRGRVNELLEQLNSNLPANAVLAKMNADDNFDLSVKLDIRSVPELLIFWQGSESERLLGDSITTERVIAAVAARQA